MPPYIAQATGKDHPQSASSIVVNLECGLTSSPDVTASPSQSPAASVETSHEGTPDRSPTLTPVQEKLPIPHPVPQQVCYVTTCSPPTCAPVPYYIQYTAPPAGPPGALAPSHPVIMTCGCPPVTYTAPVPMPSPNELIANPGGVQDNPPEGSQSSPQSNSEEEATPQAEATGEAKSLVPVVTTTEAGTSKPYPDPLALSPTDPQLMLYQPTPQLPYNSSAMPIVGPYQYPYPYPYPAPMMPPGTTETLPSGTLPVVPPPLQAHVPRCAHEGQAQAIAEQSQTHVGHSQVHAGQPQAIVGQPQAHAGQSQANMGQCQALVEQPPAIGPTYTMAPMPQGVGPHAQSGHHTQPLTSAYTQQSCCTQGACCHAVQPQPPVMGTMPQYYAPPGGQNPNTADHPPPTSSTTSPCVSISQNMELVWHGEFNRCFQAFGPHRWFLMPVDKPPSELSATIWPENLYLPSVPWRTFRDSAKVRFCCDSCGNGWTSMKGRVIFWFHQDPTSGVGYVLFKLYGQQCKRCANGQFEHAMWYPDEVIKVIVNVYHRVGQVYYSFYRPPLRVDRRQGKPREQHNAELCQACKEGLCKEELMFT